MLLKRGKKTANDLSVKRPKPWEMADMPERAKILHQFCFKEAQEVIQFYIDDYKQRLLYRKLAESMFETRANLLSQNMSVELSSLLLTVQELMMLTDYRFDIYRSGALSSDEADLLWQLLAQPRQHAIFEAIADENLLQIAEWRTDIKEGRELADIEFELDEQEQRIIEFKRKLVQLRELLHQTELFARLLSQMSFLFRRDTRPLMGEDELFESLSDANSFGSCND